MLDPTARGVDFEPAPARRRRSLASRLLSVRVGKMLWRNTVVSTGVFLIGLALLWMLVQQAGMAKVPAAAVSFVIGNTLQYIFGRLWIFRGTTRGRASGLALFFVNAAIGLVVTTGLFAAMLAWTSIHYLLARTLVSVVAGLVMFVLNAVFNFRRV